MPSQFYHKENVPEAANSAPLIHDKLSEATDFTRSKLGKVRGLLDDDVDVQGHVANIDTIGLGRSAVMERMVDAAKAIVGGEVRPPGGIEALIDAGFDRLTELNDWQRVRFNEYMAKNEMPAWLQDALFSYQGDRHNDHDYITALTEKNADGYALSYETRANFFEWHNALLAKKTEILRAQIEQLLPRFKTTVKRLVDDGVLPESARRQLSTLNSIEYSLDDGFTTTLVPYSTSAIAGSAIKTNEHVGHMVLGPEIADLTSRDSRDTLYHEWVHMMEGINVNTTVSEDVDVVWRPNHSSGLIRLMSWDDDEDGGLMLEEASTETIAQVIRHDLGGIDASIDRVAGESYRQERRLLAFLRSRGLKDIDLATVADAKFSNDAASAISRLREKIIEAFPFVDPETGDGILDMIKKMNRHNIVYRTYIDRDYDFSSDFELEDPDSPTPDDIDILISRNAFTDIDLELARIVRLNLDYVNQPGVDSNTLFKAVIAYVDTVEAYLLSRTQTYDEDFSDDADSFPLMQALDNVRFDISKQHKDVYARVLHQYEPTILDMCRDDDEARDNLLGLFTEYPIELFVEIFKVDPESKFLDDEAIRNIAMSFPDTFRQVKLSDNQRMRLYSSLLNEEALDQEDADEFETALDQYCKNTGYVPDSDQQVELTRILKRFRER